MSVDFDAADPAPEPVAAPVAEPIAEPPAPEPPPDPDEVGAVEIQGGKHVPLEALKAARAEARAAKEQASRLPALEQQIAQMQGSLATFQQLQRTASYPPAPPTNIGPTADPDMRELALSLDYINPQTGQPDLERAAKHNAIIMRQAQKIAQQMISPLQQQSARAQSHANYQAATQMQAANGTKASKATLDWMWQNLPPEYTADPRVAQALPALALGLEAMAGTGAKLPPAVAPPGAPPLHTEGAGGGPMRRAAPITQAERDLIGARGMKEETYLKHTKDFVKGRAVSLEDD